MDTMHRRTNETGVDADLSNLGLDAYAVIEASSAIALNYLANETPQVAAAGACLDGIRLGTLIGRGMVEGE